MEIREYFPNKDFILKNSCKQFRTMIALCSDKRNTESVTTKMHITLRTQVEQDHHSVYKGFNESLFLQLSPPLLPFELICFDGCETGDRVVLKVGFPLQTWESLIVSHGSSPTDYYFVDEGVKLPRPLKKWHHRHGIEANDSGGSIITDEITFSTGLTMLDIIVYPLMYSIFAYRKGVYRRVFKH
jgi:ligand-binding SRPBCC domain-containing protein